MYVAPTSFQPKLHDATRMLGRHNLSWGDVTWGDKAMGPDSIMGCLYINDYFVSRHMGRRGELEGQEVGEGDWEWSCKFLSDAIYCFISHFMYMTANLFQPY